MKFCLVLFLICFAYNHLVLSQDNTKGPQAISNYGGPLGCWPWIYYKCFAIYCPYYMRHYDFYYHCWRYSPYAKADNENVAFNDTPDAKIE
ncbi:unnamed protein product [Gordionus sp. m RMFG-2023]